METNIKENIFFELVNEELNRDRIEKMPHRKVLDLAMIYRVLVDSNEAGGVHSYEITDTHLREWEMTEEELYSIAMENTPRVFPEKALGIGDFFMEAGCGLPAYDGIPMIILTNKEKIYGAGALLYSDTIKSIAKTKDIYVIPSSIHEMLLIPDNVSVDFLKSIVREVNDTQVRDAEKLSYSVYKYSTEDGLQIAA